MKKAHILVLSLLPLHLFAASNLQDIYQLAAQKNATYLNAKATYEAAKYGAPIAFAALLPQAVLSGNTTATRTSTNSLGYYNTHQYTLTATQPIIDFGAWANFAEAKTTVEIAAVTFATAEQTLITSVSSAYFQVLQDEDQLKYAKANEDYLAQLLKQTQAQYSVGLKALTDVQATQAQYESAIATRVQAENTLASDREALNVVAGETITDLIPLKTDFPLVKPDPENIDDWVNAALKNNLALQSAYLQAEANKQQIHVDEWGSGTSTSPGYLPALDAVGTYQKAQDNSTTNGIVSTQSGSLQATWQLFNGGLTYNTVKKDDYTYQAAQFNAEATRRSTVSGARQSYLNVLSDIEQIEALKQAVISGESSLKAIQAGYLVGTRTIVDVLQQQSSLFQNEQQYAQAIYSYINDSLTLKENAGTLAPQDLFAINDWLDNHPLAPLPAQPTAAPAPVSTPAPAPAVEPAAPSVAPGPHVPASIPAQVKTNS